MSVNPNIDAACERCVPPTGEVRSTADGKTESPNCTQRSIEMLTLLNDVFDGEEIVPSPQTTADTAGSGRSV